MVSNKLYDFLKVLAAIVLPISEFITAILTIWKVPYCQQITATLAAFDILIGALVVALSKLYAKAIDNATNSEDQTSNG